uniref:Uncharacterized protein n=1 Tax=Sphaerodactylus townsendi TaxID=933632 RepID=A0ACB8FBA9_9SAUR
MTGACSCLPGFIGADCGKTCPQNHHGKDCTSFCSCGKGHCDPVTGKCYCPPGRIGPSCLHVCPQGRYGPYCQLKCLCKNGGICDPVNGTCTCGLGWTGKYCEKDLLAVVIAQKVIMDIPVNTPALLDFMVSNAYTHATAKMELPVFQALGSAFVFLASKVHNVKKVVPLGGLEINVNTSVNVKHQLGVIQ